ncbi:hypothetical protein [Mycolicibacterium aromaticivorans]|nr:hypothetical protein [Mycolicibacterium aromaticivorans]
MAAWTGHGHAFEVVVHAIDNRYSGAVPAVGDASVDQNSQLTATMSLPE